MTLEDEYFDKIISDRKLVHSDSRKCFGIIQGVTVDKWSLNIYKSSLEKCNEQSQLSVYDFNQSHKYLKNYVSLN